VAINAKFQEMLGYDAEELYGSTFSQLTHVDDREENLRLFREVINEKRPFFRIEKRFIRKNGDILWVRVTASPIKTSDGILSYTVGFIEDIGYRREMEEKLRENEEKFRSFLEHAIDAIVIIQGSVFKYVNPQMTQLTGYSKDEILSASCDMVLGSGNRSICEICRRRLAGEDLPDLYESVLNHKDGHRIDVEIGACNLTFDGHPAELVFIRDITERKMLEAERLKSSMLESVGLLAGGIAHDFNNLLTVILGNTNIIQMRLVDNDDLSRFLDNIENASMRAQQLTKKLITFSTGGYPVRKKCSLKSIVEIIIRDEFSQSKARWKIDFAENLWPVEIDREMIGQAISNVVINSIESMPDGGTVEISCENFFRQNNDEIFSSLQKDGKYVKLVIRDHGIGIETENLNRVFDPYFSTKDRGSKKGMGLGLAIVQSVVKKNKGMVNIESQPGQGTLVTIYLPAAE
jgi:PAS domain S-box-containing protein